ncbi:uncharacterized protein LOC126670660 [Mercurialis annua]|uniref:uncharacterized protein LOC126670660 n=1 Tax=Mercurialis annua TaxID=3986 RepID=UPI00215F4BB0|nr:uncharacterized protein LOC126670660 [Mercurialis annua]XP_055960802.1 uncharacterized protein LOC126670660 [Mercurialis annua]
MHTPHDPPQRKQIAAMATSNSVNYQTWFRLPSSTNINKKLSKIHHPPVSKLDEIRVCTNRTCRRQGSTQTLEIIRDISPPHVSVNSCGCLGCCGAGPNLAILPQGILVGHCGTPASAARIIAGHYYNHDDNDAAIRSVLEAVSLRKRAEIEIDQANFSQAELLLSQAIELKPFGGLHIIYKCRSTLRLAMKNYSGALEDAREALNLAPQYPEAYLCEGDVFMAMEKYEAAEKSYLMCLDVDPTIRRSKPFKARVAKLNEKLIASDMPHSHNQQ